MTSSDSDLIKINGELNCLSLKEQQLLQRRKIQCILKELNNRPEFHQTELSSLQNEVDSIDNQLKELYERRAELQKCHKANVSGSNKNIMKKVSFVNSEKCVPKEPVHGSNIFYIETPPSTPAPEVILDITNLPPRPSRIQCPGCRQFIVTETFTSVTFFTWIVCFSIAMIGCVAGCCFIPFCTDACKSTTHRCPKCRALITTVKKL